MEKYYLYNNKKFPQYYYVYKFVSYNEAAETMDFKVLVDEVVDSEGGIFKRGDSIRFAEYFVTDVTPLKEKIKKLLAYSDSSYSRIQKIFGNFMNGLYPTKSDFDYMKKIYKTLSKWQKLNII